MPVSTRSAVVETTPDSPWPLTALAVLGWALLDVVAGGVFAATSRRYRAMPRGHKRVWSNRVVSIVHALVVAIGATRVILLDPELQRSFVYVYSPPGAVYLAAFCGYTMYDLAVITVRHFDPTAVPPGAVLFGHHFVSLGMVCIQQTTDLFSFPSVALLINEWSTPLLHARYFMSDVDVPKGHWMVHANNVAFALTFFVCRVLLNCWLVYRLAFAFFLDPAEAYVLTGARVVPVVGFALASAFAAINVYWFVFIIRKAIAPANVPSPRETGSLTAAAGPAPAPVRSSLRKRGGTD